MLIRPLQISTRVGPPGLWPNPIVRIGREVTQIMKVQSHQISEGGLKAVQQRVGVQASVIIVSYNTQNTLQKCLEHLSDSLEGMQAEIVVVDNNSQDGSAEMVASKFPTVRLIRSNINLGFAAANNRAFQEASGEYFILLNSDAFVAKDTIRRSFKYMEARSDIAAGGARLVGADGSWQPSVRKFPSVLNDALIYTGLASRFPKSRFFGRVDRTWDDSSTRADGDWVPGAFTIIRRKALEACGAFDDSFFLYYEEVDLCRRFKRAGYRISYFPDVVVVHLGGESSKTQEGLCLSKTGKQLTLWRLRSEFLYYRKHHGELARVAMWSERTWNSLRLARNLLRGCEGRAKADESRSMIALIDQAWNETKCGTFSPTRPW
jgi:GT2 family glycosyltransferase